MERRRRALSAPLFDTFANSAAVQVFEGVLASIYDGTLRPGDPVSENDIARRYGLSRTPAREAVQRLRELGLVETSAGRTSRVVLVTEAQLRHSLVVWQALMAAVADEVADRVDAADLELMERSAQEFLDAVGRSDAVAAAQANYDLFDVPVARSTNPMLVKTVALTVHVVRLGGLSLPRWIDGRLLADAQRAFVDALAAGDADAAKAAVGAAAGFRLVEDA
ncbi:GntR family transcriptional regulator [Microbacterium sp. CJ88]|uniref:GntR family transcriptional regulator n=1 Tax=Microbacterium sp. CJ88 TaxID=3445672 RepID=UPI003F65A61D